jgi:flagellar biosynthesis protein FliQ
MDTSLVMDIALDSLKVTILVAAPILAAALISGLLVGILPFASDGFCRGHSGAENSRGQ